MFRLTRRILLSSAAASIAATATHAPSAPAEHLKFIEAAFRMRDAAVSAGDQAYGAVVVKNDRIVGFGPSRVVQRNDWSAHAEREAIRDARARLGSRDLSGAVLYSSSRPCPQCEAAAAEAGIVRMIHGRDGVDAGRPGRP